MKTKILADFQICISVPLMQKFYFNLFLQKEVGHRYLNIRSFDKVAKDCCNEFSKSIFFWAGVEEFLFK